MSNDDPDRILRLPEALALTGHSKTPFYAKVKAGLIPKPVRLGAKAVGWRRNELLEYVRALPRAA